MFPRYRIPGQHPIIQSPSTSLPVGAVAFRLFDRRIAPFRLAEPPLFDNNQELEEEQKSIHVQPEIGHFFS